MPINTRAIRTAQVGDVLTDDQVPGLSLRCFDSSKAFYLRYRTKANQQRGPKLGEFGVLTLEQARDAARAILRKVAAGEDPKGAWDDIAASPTVAVLAKKFFADYAPKKKKEKSVAEDKRLWEKFLEPKIGKHLVALVDHDTMEGVHNGLSDTPYQANRVIALASILFTMSEVWKGEGQPKPMRPLGTNPCQHIERFKEHKRKRRMTPAEAVRIIEQLDAREAGAPASVAFIRLLIYTGARCQAIAAACWDWKHGDRIDFPPGLMKTDDETLFLSKPALDIIEKLPRTSGTIVGIESPKTVWEKIREAAGCPDLRLHDLRRSFASIGLSHGMSLSEIGRLLNHSEASTTQGYSYLDERRAREGVAIIGDAIDRLTGRKEPSADAAVSSSAPLH